MKALFALALACLAEPGVHAQELHEFILKGHFGGGDGCMVILRYFLAGPNIPRTDTAYLHDGVFMFHDSVTEPVLTQVTILPPGGGAALYKGGMYLDPSPTQAERAPGW